MMFMDEEIMKKIERMKVLEREIQELKEKQEALKVVRANIRPKTIEELLREYGLRK